MQRKTKIVCTIGPVSSTPEKLQRLAEEGMDVARINFSHGSHASNLQIIENLKALREHTGRSIGILQDLGGPKIRVGELPPQGMSLPEGQTVRLTPAPVPDAPELRGAIPVNYPHLMTDVPVGARILLDDGMLELRVEARAAHHLECTVVHGGLLSSHKGVNFPDLTLTQRAPTAKDVADLQFGLDQGVDYVALSFVQEAEDMRNLRELVAGVEDPPRLIAKLERTTAIDNLDSILEVSDGVMVARGDLGIEGDLSMIPVYQKQIIRKANLRGVLTVTATQMLDSMIRNPLPTRAEVTDVANAIYDGSDAIMLSGETAVGGYPVESVQMMRRVADHVERNLGLDRGWVRAEEEDQRYSPQLAVARSVCHAAERLSARCIVAQTISGSTARLISMYRPAVPIVAVTPLRSTWQQLSLVWGVHPLMLREFRKDFLQTAADTDRLLVEKGLACEGELVIISAGIPALEPGGTNVMKVHVVGRG
ncbi:MAG: pyruvate kinase [Spirochaetales bacterium]|nr:pyruvate kinase [Spirochaetales bacterium]